MSDIVLDNAHFQNWKRRLESNGVKIENLEVRSVISRDNASMYAAFLDCKIETPEKTSMPRCILIRGNSVVVIPVLTCLDDNEKYTMLVQQRRIVDGAFCLEFPGGMLDEGVLDGAGMAAQEVAEELDMEIRAEELRALNSRPLYACESILDETVSFFYFEKQVSKAFLDSVDGKSTGCHEDHEYINVKVKRLSELSDIPSFAIVTGMSLLEKALGESFA